MITLNHRLSYATFFYMAIGLLVQSINASEQSPINSEGPTPTSVLARCYLRYSKDNRPQHKCTMQIKEFNNMTFTCSMKDAETSESAVPVCHKLMTYLYALSAGSFPSRFDTGLPPELPLYIHPKSEQFIDFVLHFDPSAPDYPHEWGGHGCSF